MRIFREIIFMLAVSYCTAQDDYEDLLMIANATKCEISSSEDNGEGVCVKESQCLVSLTMPDPEISVIQCKYMTGCCPRDKVISTHEKKDPIISGCGYSKPGGSSFRSFGNKATYAEFADFPWMVAVMVKKNIPDKTFKDEYIGGGTLIHPSVVMTVAHNVYQAKPEQLKCRAGEWNWIIEIELYKYQERDVENVIVNENFNKVTIAYDVALLILSSPYNLENAPHIGMGCLEHNMPSPGTVCYSMGWGEDIQNNKKNAVILKKLQLPLVDADMCEKSLKATRLGRLYKLHESFTCAGGEADVDTCQGDGGSPLVCSIPDPDLLRYSVVGMVAYGVDCGKENIPGVYANVPMFYDWVINKMTTHNLNTSTFKYDI